MRKENGQNKGKMWIQGVCEWEWGRVWEKTLERRIGNRFISNLSTPSISIAISLVQSIIIFSVDLAVAFVLVSQSPRLPASNP